MVKMSMVKLKTISSEKKAEIIKVVVAFSFPVLLCFAYCLLRGINIFQLYLPNSYNNDSLYYYKLVEGILSSGISKGYYGFNESRALIGSFAAWSPALLFPWVIWGSIFGWGYGSVLVSNIFYFSVALALFVYLTKIEWKNICIIFTVLALYPSLPIHLLSALPEVVVASIMIVYFGFAIRAVRENYKLWCVVPMFILSLYLTICRPYMIILVLLPCFYLFKAKRKLAWLFSLLLIGFGLVAYFVCSYFFTSEYFTPLFDLSVLELIFKGKLTEAFWLGVAYFKGTIAGVYEFVYGAFSYGLTAGTQYVVSIMVVFFLMIISVFTKRKEQRSVNIIFVINVVSVFFAILLLLRKANEGGRHLWVFSIVGCVLCFSNFFSKRLIVAATLMIGVLGIFLAKGSLVPTDYDVPVMNAELENDIEYWNQAFSDKAITVSKELGYENTCIWVLTDNGEITNHKELYALPKGMGISCCMEDYVTANIKTLKSRFIATVAGGAIDKLCEQNGYEELGRTNSLVIYKMY